ncbi:hypothetical protein [Streptomyces sp. WAC06614]|uniref:hypothetical protein n=1 Tax=Streptomyces sp. WAC06614 TaxID=2487416 RepID=UPI000F7B6636|nr:hypothetical protein [Streptomyces sp. WAC06614]RSS81160.1 hypothetical protein EF918_11235 [Streptomyces sp. WAC06614]
MRYLILGRGELDADERTVARGIGRVAVPDGTAIDVYADDGRGLVYGSYRRGIWDQLHGPLHFLHDAGTVVNLTLHGDPVLLDEDYARYLESFGFALVRPGIDAPDPLRLCTGAPGECPAGGEPAQDTTHTCDGVLGLAPGAELYWLVCSSFVPADEEAVSRGSAASDSSGSDGGGDFSRWGRSGGRHPDESGEESSWTTDSFDPGSNTTGQESDSFDQQPADARNRYNLECAVGRPLTYRAGGSAFLVGTQHYVGAEQYVRAQDDYFTGGIRTIGYGTVAVSGVPREQRAHVRAAVRRFCGMGVEFSTDSTVSTDLEYSELTLSGSADLAGSGGGSGADDHREADEAGSGESGTAVLRASTEGGGGADDLSPMSSAPDEWLAALDPFAQDRDASAGS